MGDAREGPYLYRRSLELCVRTVKHTEYVVSTGDAVELFLNGRSLGRGERSSQYLFTFKNIPYEPGTLTAVSYRDGQKVSRYQIETAGAPDHLRVTAMTDPEGFRQTALTWRSSRWRSSTSRADVVRSRTACSISSCRARANGSEE